MKKTSFAIALMGALAMTSCSNDDVMNNAPDTGSTITFTATLPADLQSRAFGDGTQTKDLHYAIYEAGTKTLVFASEGGVPQATLVKIDEKNFSLSADLVKGKSYDFVFWADATGNNFYTFDPASQSVSINYDKLVANDDTRDAFFQTVKDINVTGSASYNVELRRPFAQLNILTDDIAKVTATGTTLGDITVTVSDAYSTLDLFSGEATGLKGAAVSFAAPRAEGEIVSVNGKAYDVLSMNYILTGSDIEGGNVQTAQKELFDVTVDINDNNGTKLQTINVSNVPVQRNYRTNIYGSLLTNSLDFNIVVVPDFYDPDLDLEISATPATADEFVAALNNPIVKEINIEQDLDLSEATTEELTFNTPKTFIMANDSKLQLGNKNTIVANNGLTIKGEGTISNTSADNSDLGRGWHKALIFVKSGDLVIDGVTIENDPTYHYHGSSAEDRPYNSAAIQYWNDTDVTITNARIISGEFTLCGMGRGVASGNIVLKDSYFESTSSSQNGTGNWAYAMRILGSTAVLEDCEVKGIQGGVSVEGGNLVCTIKSGKYYTVNTPGKNDAFYPVYVTNAANVIIEGGEFIGARSLSNLCEGTSAVVVGDNDTHMPVGFVTIKGGKFSGKAYNHVTNSVYQPDQWVALEGEEPLKWTISE